jgi:bisphosphoglycerate-independent phosphoglycerate mutase (AlkP superfamily)
VGEKAEDVVKAIEEKYKVDETDEFLKPLIVNGDAVRIKGQSSGLLVQLYCLTFSLG